MSIIETTVGDRIVFVNIQTVSHIDFYPSKSSVNVYFAGSDTSEYVQIEGDAAVKFVNELRVKQQQR